MLDWLISKESTSLEFDILRRGTVYAHDLSNALSDEGLAMWGAIRRGFLRSARREGQGTVYEITEAGRAALERERTRRLAEIGVYEVH